MANPNNLNIYLGTHDVAQERRAAYDKAANGQSTSEWAREILDKAAGFTPKK